MFLNTFLLESVINVHLHFPNRGYSKCFFLHFPEIIVGRQKLHVAVPPSPPPQDPLT